MKAVLLDGFGGPEVLKIADTQIPTPVAGQVLVKVVATSVNRPDIVQREGHYPPPKGDSEIPGLEVAGIIEETGPGVTSCKSGDRVMSLVGGGGYAQYAVAWADHLIPIPEAMELPTIDVTRLVLQEAARRAAGQPSPGVISIRFRLESPRHRYEGVVSTGSQGGGPKREAGGAGGSRTRDYGFADRRLSHLATAPQREQLSARDDFDRAESMHRSRLPPGNSGVQETPRCSGGIDRSRPSSRSTGPSSPSSTAERSSAWAAWVKRAGSPPGASSRFTPA